MSLLVEFSLLVPGPGVQEFLLVCFFAPKKMERMSMDVDAIGLLVAHIVPVLFSICTAVASGAVGAFAVMGLIRPNSRVQLVLGVCSVVVVAAAFIAALARLQRFDRFFNAFVQISSPLSQCLIALAILIALVVAVLFLLRQSEASRVLYIVMLAAVVVSTVPQGRLLCASSHLFAETPVAVIHMLALVLIVGAVLAGVCGGADGGASRRAVGLCVTGGGVAATISAAVMFGLRATVDAGNFGSYANPVTFTRQVCTVGFLEFAVDDCGVLFWLGVAALVAVVVLGVVVALRLRRSRMLAGGYDTGLLIASFVCAVVGSGVFQVIYLAGVGLTKVSLFG